MRASTSRTFNENRERISKLPRWAQDLLLSLSNEILDLEQARDRREEAEADGRLPIAYVRGRYPDPDRPILYEGETIIFRSGDEGQYQISAKGQALEVMLSSARGSLSVEPRVSNVIVVRPAHRD